MREMIAGEWIEIRYEDVVEDLDRAARRAHHQHFKLVTDPV